MSDRKIRLAKNVDLTQLELDAEDGFVLSRLDVPASLPDLVRLTGMPEEKLGEVLDRLREQGALEPDEETADTMDAEGLDETLEALDEGLDEELLDDDLEDLDEEQELDEETESARSWRRIFEEDLHPLAVDARVEKARRVDGETLCAFCFDPSPRVVSAILDNPQSGLQHARLIAEHHRSGFGLDHVARRPELIRDTQVQRFLFRNPLTSGALVKRILGSKRMAEVYRLCMNRETTEKVRAATRRELRKKFGSGSSEERVNLILKSEGRCLALLIGLPLDGKAASLLCRRTFQSTLLIQNLARWPATPPVVLQHMFRQPMVKRSTILKNLILRHPNAPSDLKRGPV